MTITRTLVGSGTQSPAPYMLGPDVVFVEVEDGTARLLDLGGQFYAVPSVATTLLRETLLGNADRIASCISEETGADLEEVQSDFDEFLGELLKKRLVIRSPSGGLFRRAKDRLFLSAVRGTLRIIHKSIRSLSLKAWFLLAFARVSVSCVGFAKTVRAWRHYPAEHCSPSVRPLAGESVIEAVDSAVRHVMARHILSIGCKERSLCCWSLLRARGIPARLNVGIHLYPLRGHCWCQSESWTPADDGEVCRGFTPVAVYE